MLLLRWWRGAGAFFRLSTAWLPNVLVPELGLGADESSHEVDAFRVIEHHKLHSVPPQPVFGAEESAIFTNDNFGNFVEQSRAGAHRAGRQSGVENALAVDAGRLAAGVTQGGHFRMQDGVGSLHALIAPPA